MDKPSFGAPNCMLLSFWELMPRSNGQALTDSSSQSLCLRWEVRSWWIVMGWWYSDKRWLMCATTRGETCSRLLPSLHSKHWLAMNGQWLYVIRFTNNRPQLGLSTAVQESDGQWVRRSVACAIMCAYIQLIKEILFRERKSRSQRHVGVEAASGAEVSKKKVNDQRNPSHESARHACSGNYDA